MEAFINAKISEDGNLDVEFNTRSKREAYIMAAAIAAELIENRNDYNTFCKVLRKVLKNENSK